MTVRIHPTIKNRGLSANGLVKIKKSIKATGKIFAQAGSGIEAKE